MLLVHWEKTRREMVQNALKRFSPEVESKLLGVVLAQVNLRAVVAGTNVAATDRFTHRGPNERPHFELSYFRPECPAANRRTLCGPNRTANKHHPDCPAHGDADHRVLIGHRI